MTRFEMDMNALTTVTQTASRGDSGAGRNPTSTEMYTHLSCSTGTFCPSLAATCRYSLRGIRAGRAASAPDHVARTGTGRRRTLSRPRLNHLRTIGAGAGAHDRVALAPARAVHQDHPVAGGHQRIDVAVEVGPAAGAEAPEVERTCTQNDSNCSVSSCRQVSALL